MKQEITAGLQQEFSRWEGSVASPVPYAEIQAAEATLGVKFPEDYREFIREFGGAVIRGASILGLRQPPLMPDEPPSVVDQSLLFRSELPEPYGKMVVISVDDAGNPIGFLPPDPTILTFDHNFGGRHDLSPSFEEYVELLLSGADA
jgi:hypothetical protein